MVSHADKKKKKKKKKKKEQKKKKKEKKRKEKKREVQEGREKSFCNARLACVTGAWLV